MEGRVYAAEPAGGFVRVAPSVQEASSAREPSARSPLATLRQLLSRLALLAALVLPVLMYPQNTQPRAPLTLLAQLAELGGWSNGALMPNKRAEAVAGRIYVVGAYSGATDANAAYDPASDARQTLASLPRG